MHGTSDPTVGVINGLAFYNALRDNGKKAVLVLKGAKAPGWLTEGVPYLKKDAKPEPPKEPAKSASIGPRPTISASHGARLSEKPNTRRGAVAP